MEKGNMEQATPATIKQPDKKVYHSPDMVEWGTVKDLTQGDALPGDDGSFGTVT